MKDNKKLYLIKPIEGFDKQIGHLLSQMNYTRHTTLQLVQDLTVEQLDYLDNPKGNTIGMLLKHIAAIEFFYQLNTFEQRDFNKEELKIWQASLSLSDLGRKEIKGNNLNYYVDLLETTRAKTLSKFAKLEDTWLYKTNKWWSGKDANNYWKWFHVFEDELNHRGQIRVIRKSLVI